VYCAVEEDLARRQGKALDLSDSVPYGLDTVDLDAVDPCTRALLEYIRRKSRAFQISSTGTEWIKGTAYPTVGGTIKDLCGTVAASCKRRARDEIGNAVALTPPTPLEQDERTSKVHLESPQMDRRSDPIFLVKVRPEESKQRTFLDARHPKFMYHPVKPPVQVYSQKEIDELGPDWSETYIRQEYPKAKYHWTGKTATVKSFDEEVALGGGWADNPAAFDPYKGPRPARTDQQDPLKWVDDWPVAGLSADDRKRIKAQLLKADATFWKSPDYPSGTANAMRMAFDGIAQVLFAVGTLAEAILAINIPTLVWNSAIAGGWWHLASERPQTIFPEKVGHYWIWRDDSRDWQNVFRSEIAEWTAKLLESSIGGSTLPTVKTTGTPKRPKYRNAKERLGSSRPAVTTKRKNPDRRKGHNRRPVKQTHHRSNLKKRAQKPVSMSLQAKEARAQTVATMIKELNCLRPQMFEDSAEYEQLRSIYPDFLSLRVADQRPDLKLKIMSIRASTRHIRLAQELAAAHHGKALATIQDDWKDYKPAEFKHHR
jgi:hypothetical protein